MVLAFLFSLPEGLLLGGSEFDLQQRTGKHQLFDHYGGAGRLVGLGGGAELGGPDLVHGLEIRAGGEKDMRGDDIAITS